MEVSDLCPGVRFFDPERARAGRPKSEQVGHLGLRLYHQTLVWMMVYDSGELLELTSGQLDELEVTE